MNYGALNTGTLNGTSSTDENATLLGGVVSGWTIQSSVLVSEFMAGGVASSWTLKANALFSDVLSGGVASSWTLNANAVFGDVLSGGVASSCALKANAVFGDVLSGGVASSCALKANDIFSDVLCGGISSGWTLPCGTLLDYYGVLNTRTLNGTSSAYEDTTLLIDCVINGGVSQPETLSAELSLLFFGGVSSTWRLTDIDVSSYYGDMLHNTWQLAVTSATLILEINTPIGDS
jgi:hypothetical protein